MSFIQIRNSEIWARGGDKVVTSRQNPTAEDILTENIKKMIIKYSLMLIEMPG